MPPDDEPYEEPADRHRHQCPGCGSVWEHADDLKWAPEVIHRIAHTCPECFDVCYDKYHGDSRPCHIDHHDPKGVKK